ncbi:MAG: hypothetical protein WAN03_04260 [Candidatus Sulfotelmatobacter sp.]
MADTVFMADGTPASGTLIISWPAFLTSTGTPVAAGNTAVTLSSNGALNVALVSNVGATPAGVYYSVTYQLGPGEVKTEYWLVPVSTTAVNLAAVRTTPGSGEATQPVSMQYVNSELATVVHLGGTETITGTKTFSTSPTVPAPTSSAGIANKSYVDSAISNVGAGNYLSTAGGTVTGPITLPANPVAALQASTKQYVDNGLAAKSDLIAGLVPANELGTGLASAGSCLLGNGASGTWGTCGSGGGAGSISINPVATQAIAQPAGTQFSANNLANIRYVTASWNWAQTPADSLGTAGANTIHLAPCPLGIDTNSIANYYSYKVYVAGTGTAEAVAVTGGSCTPGGSSGTITVTTAHTHAAGYTVGSASTGIQEAWNDAWANDTGVTAQAQVAPYVKLAAGQAYNVYATVYLRGRGGLLDGAGALITCSTRDRCIYVGTTQGGPYVNHHKLYNLSGTSAINVDGVQVAGISATSGTYTVTTASAHPFVVGDVVDCEYYSTNAGGHWTTSVLSVPNSTTFTLKVGGATVAAGAATFGFCNLLNTFLENNSDHVVAQDINLFQSNPGGMGYFSYGIVNDNDQQFIVERASNRSSLVLNATANWPMAAFLYERADQGNAGITYMHDSEITGVNCATGGGNGIVISDSVCQGFPTYGIRYFGGLQPATFSNIYEESTGGSVNPLYGYAAQDGFLIQGGLGSKILGTFPISGLDPGFATGGGGAAERTYFVVPRSSTQGYGPVLYAGWAEPASGGTSIPLMWPSVELQNNVGQSLGTLTWDVLVTTGTGTSAPYGSGMYVIASNISGNCGTNGMCSFTDTQAAPGAYTVQSQQFLPVFWFWPVSIVINGSTVLTEVAGTNPSAVASQGTTSVSIVAEQCKSIGPSQRRSPIWVSCLASETSGGSGSIATVLQEQDTAGNGPAVNSKGRLNFGKAIGTPNDLLTLQDSNFGKTVTASGERPSNDAGDMAIGLDQAGGLAQRAASSISSYINVAPNSGATNFLERLTSAGKTFNVPVTVNGNFSVPSGTVTLPVTGAVQCLHVSSTGLVSGTGADCGSGGGGGSGTVNSGATSQVAMYSANGSAVSGDGALTDNGATLSYLGTGGISASGGAFSGNVTAGGISAGGGTFSGNLTVGGQVIMTGPWLVNSPVPATAMGTAAAGTSSLGISYDGNFYVSANAGAVSRVLTVASDAVPSVFGRAGAVTATTGDYTCAQVTGCTANTTTVNGHALSGNVTVSAADLGLGALPSGTTATTQAVGDSSTKVATTAFVMQQASLATPWIPFPGYDSINQAAFSTAANTAAVYGFIVPTTITTSKVVYRVGSTADNTANTYEIGIYNGSGTLVAHYEAAGTTFSPATGATKTQSWAEGTVTLPPGKYYEAIVSSCTASCATFTTGNGTVTTFYSNSAFTQNVSGSTLGTTITAPGAGNESFGASPLSIILE